MIWQFWISGSKLLGVKANNLKSNSVSWVFRVSWVSRVCRVYRVSRGCRVRRVSRVSRVSRASDCHRARELFQLQTWISPYLAYWRNTESQGRGSAEDVANMQTDISNGFMSCRVVSTQCGASATLQATPVGA